MNTTSSIPGWNVRVAARTNLLGLGIEPVAQDRKVVRPEIPERVHILPDLTEVQPLRVDVENVAYFPGVDVRLQPSAPRR